MTKHNQNTDTFKRDRVLHTIDSMFWTVEAEGAEIMLYTDDECLEMDTCMALEMAAALIAVAARAVPNAGDAFTAANDAARQWMQDIQDKRHIDIDKPLQDAKED